MRVDEILTRPVATVPRDASVDEARARLRALGIRHLVVVDRGGAAVGALTDTLLDELSGVRGPAGVAAVAVEVRVEPDDDLLDVLPRMAASGQDFVLAVDAAGAPLGIATEHDLVGAAIRRVPVQLGALGEGTAPADAVPPDADAGEVGAALVSRGRRHVLVAEPGGPLVGVCSYRDLAGTPPGVATVGQRCTRSPLVTLGPSATLAEAAQALHDHRIGCVPIVAPRTRHPVGVVTRRDVIQAVARALDGAAAFGGG